jgi:hypothetical protein
LFGKLPLVLDNKIKYFKETLDFLKIEKSGKLKKD